MCLWLFSVWICRLFYAHRSLLQLMSILLSATISNEFVLIKNDQRGWKLFELIFERIIIGQFDSYIHGRRSTVCNNTVITSNGQETLGNYCFSCTASFASVLRQSKNYWFSVDEMESIFHTWLESLIALSTDVILSASLDSARFLHTNQHFNKMNPIKGLIVTFAPQSAWIHTLDQVPEWSNQVNDMPFRCEPINVKIN